MNARDSLTASPLDLAAEDSGRSSSLAVRRVDTLTVEEHAALKVYGYMDHIDDLYFEEDMLDRARRIRDATVHSLARMKTSPDVDTSPSDIVWFTALKLIVMSWKSQGHSQEDGKRDLKCDRCRNLQKLTRLL
jgi:hypothetical protein